MHISPSYIAYFLSFIFAFLGVQKIMASYSDPCSDIGYFCTNATMYVYKPWSAKKNKCATQQIEDSTFSMSCETVFITPFNILEEQKKSNYSHPKPSIGFIHVIHSTTYINQIDKPPIYKEV